MLCNAVKWDERYWALGATGREAARYRLGTAKPTWQNLRKAKFWQDPLRADTRRSLREALCAEETEAGSGGAYRACVLCCIFTYTSLSQGKLFEYYCSPPP